MYYTNQYEQAAESLYPQIYHDLNVHVKRVCQRVDRPNSAMLYGLPSKEMVDQMVEEVYDAYHTETLASQSKESYMPEDEYYAAQRNPLRNLISIILIGELLRRRRRLYPYPIPYPAPYRYLSSYPYY